MIWKRDILPIVNKIPLEEEGDDLYDWLTVPFEEKMKSLERMRIFQVEISGKTYPGKMDKSIVNKQKLYAAISH